MTKLDKTRRCIITGITDQPEHLLKFVVGPDQKLCFDLDHKLPGRSFWLRATPGSLEKALFKNAFSRAARQKVVTDDISLSSIDTQLMARIISMIAMGRRCGQSTGGIDKVLKKILAYRGRLDHKKNNAQAGVDPDKMIIFCAKDCGRDNLEKILRQIRDYGDFFHVERELCGSEIGRAFGRSSLAFCAIDSGKMSQKLYGKLKFLTSLRKE